MNAITLRMSRLLRSFKSDRDGASAIEFAILAPLLITLYFGCVEITDGIATDRKVTLTAGALANLTSQSQTISADGMTNILNASAAIIKPYSVGNLTATITCLKIDGAGIAKVKWSATLNGTARAENSTVTLPDAALQVPNSSLVWSEVSYNYTPVVGYTITGSIPLADQMFMSPRITPPTYDNGGGVKTCN
jgi:Flp pilus assembly protein TadG